MRNNWANQPFLSPRRGLPFSLSLLCAISVLALIAAFRSSSSKSFDSGISSSSFNAYRSYRRLREDAVNDFLEIRSLSLGIARKGEHDLCGKERENYVPCYNVSANQLSGFHDGEEFDRHCEVAGAGPRCLVRPPKEYKIPMRWPAGRDVIWSGNVKITKDQFLSSGSMTKRLMILEENQLAFHSDDGDDGVKDYSRQIAEMIGLSNDSEFLKAGVRNVLDIGCGFGSFGAHLFSLNLMTICIAAYEIFGSQVQMALERGLPAMIGNFISRQLPYPSLSFDMVHCAQCGIIWDQKGGAFLIEVDRVLKPGGYFVLTLPTSNPQASSLTMKKRNMFTPVEELTDKICWSLLDQRDETFVWQKTANINCYASRKPGGISLCKDGNNLDQYYRPLLSCISGTASNRWVPVQNRSYQPSDTELSSDELAIHGVHPEDFLEDSHFWSSALKNYWSLLTPLIFSDHPKRPGDEDPLPPFNMLRNVMDMNAHYGGLNAAFLEAKKSVWVMNVVPITASNTLPLILDRGFTGVSHNWCEPFPTYPRTYDMLHATGLLSLLLDSKFCDISDLFLEMDRILRPEGWVFLCDKDQVIEKARYLATQNRWDARVIELRNDEDQRLLVCQKPFLKK